jgi:hypothetical protein
MELELPKLDTPVLSERFTQNLFNKLSDILYLKASYNNNLENPRGRLHLAQLQLLILL